MDSKNSLKPLSHLGLNKYEAKVYLSLISEGISTAKSISDVTGIPYGKVYEIINSLSYKGFSMILPSKPMKYKAISPHQAVLTAKKATFDKFEELENNLIKQLEPLFAKNKATAKQPKTVFSIISGRSNVVNRTEELIKKAKKNIHIQCSANSLARLTLHKEVLKEAANRGIKISIAGITNKENLAEIKSLDFCSIRHVKNSKNNFISIDGKESIVTNPLPDDDNIVFGRDLGIQACSNSFTKFLDHFFVSSFRRARQVKLNETL